LEKNKRRGYRIFGAKATKKKRLQKARERRSRKVKTKFAIEESKRVSSMSWQEMLQKEKERQEKQAKKHTHQHTKQHNHQAHKTRTRLPSNLHQELTNLFLENRSKP
jgi:hypothetical protein